MFQIPLMLSLNKKKRERFRQAKYTKKNKRKHTKPKYDKSLIVIEMNT